MTEEDYFVERLNSLGADTRSGVDTNKQTYWSKNRQTY